MDPRTRIEFRSVDIQLFIVSNKTLCNKEQSKSQGGKETTKSKKSPVAPSPKSPVIFLILTFDILSEQAAMMQHCKKAYCLLKSLTFIKSSLRIR